MSHDCERDLTLYQERIYTSYDIVESLMKDEPKIVDNASRSRAATA